ncbi:hypothetical protein M427DRAFT_448882 [Gonapodya prolifera JEL478]|uniref:Uncharacterized protein n=1 Tax=Gonapodya prolifera (strain JEL478) TaxID=1344416 RepID=A0A139AS51_GONPJ|nr:hypothetical protein M427DRAFT_448882 [Gonapodya prolifera JEL478]|eukprot:KXS19373.1 hypothetical protein M427DRAFT_448882 [Gonapodya prolifera JEL478]
MYSAVTSMPLDSVPPPSRNGLQHHLPILSPSDHLTPPHQETMISSPSRRVTKAATPIPRATSVDPNIKQLEIVEKNATREVETRVSSSEGIVLAMPEKVERLESVLRDLYPHLSNHLDQQMMCDFLAQLEERSSRVIAERTEPVASMSIHANPNGAAIEVDMGITTSPDVVQDSNSASPRKHFEAILLFDGTTYIGGGSVDPLPPFVSNGSDTEIVDKPFNAADPGPALPHGDQGDDVVSRNNRPTLKRVAQENLESAGAKRTRMDELPGDASQQGNPTFEEVLRVLENREYHLERALDVLESTSSSLTFPWFSGLLSEAFLRPNVDLSETGRVVDFLEQKSTWVPSLEIIAVITNNKIMAEREGTFWRLLLRFIRTKSFSMSDEIAHKFSDAFFKRALIREHLELVQYTSSMMPQSQVSAFLQKRLLQLFNMVKDSGPLEVTVDLIEQLLAVGGMIEEVPILSVLRSLSRAKRLDLADRVFRCLKKQNPAAVGPEVFETMLDLAATEETSQKALQTITEMNHYHITPTNKQLALVKAVCIAPGTVNRFITVWQETLHKFSTNVQVEVDLCSEVVELCVKAHLYPQAFWTVAFMKTRNFDIRKAIRAILAWTEKGLEISDPVALVLDVQRLRIPLSVGERAFLFKSLVKTQEFQTAASLIDINKVDEEMIVKIGADTLLHTLVQAAHPDACTFIRAWSSQRYSWQDVALLAEQLASGDTNSSALLDLWERYLSSAQDCVPSEKFACCMIRKLMTKRDWKATRQIFVKMRERRVFISATNVRVFLEDLERNLDGDKVLDAAFEAFCWGCERQVIGRVNTEAMLKRGHFNLNSVSSSVEARFHMGRYLELFKNWSSGTLPTGFTSGLEEKFRGDRSAIENFEIVPPPTMVFASRNLSDKPSILKALKDCFERLRPSLHSSLQTEVPMKLLVQKSALQSWLDGIGPSWIATRIYGIEMETQSLLMLPFDDNDLSRQRTNGDHESLRGELRMVSPPSPTSESISSKAPVEGESRDVNHGRSSSMKCESSNTRWLTCSSVDWDLTNCQGVLLLRRHLSTSAKPLRMKCVLIAWKLISRSLVVGIITSQTFWQK